MTRSKAESQVARFWDHESRSWGQKYGRTSSYFYRRRTFHEYFAATGLERAAILDYGCGSGDITFPMLQAGHTVTGIDIAEGMVKKAAERAAQAGLAERATYHHLSDAVLARVASEKFNVVVCSSVLEYVEKDDDLVRLFHGSLLDDGYLLVSVPDRNSVFCRMDRWMHANKKIMPRFIPVEKLNYIDIQQRQYDVREFVQKLKTMGFTLVSRKYNSITLQRGLIMEKFSNIPGVGMLALMMFKKSRPGM